MQDIVNGFFTEKESESSISVIAYELEAALAQGNFRSIHKFGANLDVSTTFEDIWAQGNIYPWQTTAQTLEIISNDANDTAAGTGAREVTILGLDSNFNLISESLATNGTSASSATSSSFIRVYRAYVSATGQLADNNAGNITVRVSGGGDIQALILAETGQTELSMYTIPAGYTGFLIGFSTSVDSSKNADVKLVKREQADLTSAPFQARRLITEPLRGLSGYASMKISAYPVLPEKTDIWARAKTNGAGTSAVSVSYDLILVQN